MYSEYFYSMKIKLFDLHVIPLHLILNKNTKFIFNEFEIWNQ